MQRSPRAGAMGAMGAIRAAATATATTVHVVRVPSSSLFPGDNQISPHPGLAHMPLPRPPISPIMLFTSSSRSCQLVAFPPDPPVYRYPPAALPLVCRSQSGVKPILVSLTDHAARIKRKKSNKGKKTASTRGNQCYD
ncbi:hypothetical protein BDZ91DRAFT_731925, partial [Kalaharituber pfeilii]